MKFKLYKVKRTVLFEFTDISELSTIAEYLYTFLCPLLDEPNNNRICSSLPRADILFSWCQLAKFQFGRKGSKAVILLIFGVRHVN